MQLRFPLYAKILLWFLLNLLFLLVIFYALFKVQFRVGLDSLLLGRAAERIQRVSQLIEFELDRATRSEWDETLLRYGKAYDLSFHLFRADGTQLAGEAIALPPQVLNRMRQGRGPFGPPRGQQDGMPFQQRNRNRNAPIPGEPVPESPPVNQPGQGFQPEAPPRGVQPLSAGPRPLFTVRTDHPLRYWVAVRLPVRDSERPRRGPITLIAVSDSLYSGGLFMVDPMPWIIGGCAVMAFSVLFWFPLVRGITRSISQVTAATERIAHGHFEARVDETRRDELGRLGQAVNSMAGRLSGFVTGQKRFLGDISHELCSPIARMQMALGILEQRSEERQKDHLRDVREEVAHMSQLVNELLAFSRAGLQQRETVLQTVALAELIARVVRREAGEGRRVELKVSGNPRVLAEPELLSRALANLVRNALHHAGAAGPVTVSAESQSDHVALVVADNGPGVPEESLQQIFDPFFRLDSSRSRDTGGVGLGLAIVKTCVEACLGSVTARNRQPSGLEIEIQLQRAAADQ